MDQETITEAPGNDSGADTSAGITTEAELANSFLERVEEQPEEKPTDSEATELFPNQDLPSLFDNTLTRSTKKHRVRLKRGTCKGGGRE